jgi:hypothetical protein
MFVISCILVERCASLPLLGPPTAGKMQVPLQARTLLERNLPVRFLGEGMMATSFPLPTFSARTHLRNDPDTRLISCVVDLNPHKQHKFLPGTGHPIVSYEEMKTYGITSAIVLNPNYYDDTVRLLERHQVSVRLVVDPISLLPLPS